MKNTVMRVLLGIAIICLFSVSYSYQQQGVRPRMAPPNPEIFNPPAQHFGYIPHPVDLSHLQPGAVYRGALPAAWDWRSHGGVTSVKNQANCGSCWAFASLGALESKILIQSGSAYDLSEENLKECNYLSYGCGGGNSFIATNYFTRQGTVLESCDPYHDWDTDICSTACAKVKQVTDWRLLANDLNTIKAAVYSNGPISTTMYASFPGFNAYDGSTVLYYTGAEAVNHAVMIVGWDDNLVHGGGAGAWICKNSWGTGWGDNGYFKIAYGSARIGENSCYYQSYKHYDYLEMKDTLYHYDEAGWEESWGYDSPTAWGLVKFSAGKDDCLQAVDFWAVDDSMSYTIYIYDNFDGSVLSNQRHAQSGTTAEAGYYSIPLTAPVWVARGDNFVVVIQFTCSGYNYPIPADRFAPIETQKTYISANGTGWYEMGAGESRDVAIRVRTKNHVHVFGGHDFNGDDATDIALFRPSTANWYLKDILRVGYGQEGDIPVNGYYDADAVADIAVFRPSSALWAIRNVSRVYYGQAGDIPVPGDYNNDNITDIAVFRPSTGMWAVKDQFEVNYGRAGDIPVPGDYDGNGTTDVAVFRPSTGQWLVKDQFTVSFGLIGDIPVPGDYDGNGTTDIAVFRPSTAKWAVKDQGISYYGTAGDIPVPGDYDGNGSTDIAIFRPSTSLWAIKDQSRAFYGVSTDIPVVR